MCSQGQYGALYEVKVDIELYVQSISILSFISSQGPYGVICAVKVDIELHV